MSPSCITCVHFVRYYIRAGRGYLPLDKGHCRRRRGQICSPAVVCGQYRPARLSLSDGEWQQLQQALSAPK